MELLFKAKRKDNGEWLESDSILQFNNHPVTKSPAASLWKEGDGWIEVDPNTVCQSIGKKDKKGNTIFENHIVKIRYTDNGCEFEEINSVEYDVDEGGFAPFTWQYSCDGCDCGCGIDSVEIIGNRFDNPNLLR